MKYAVLDWDNTIRSYFTLFSWMDFLYSKNILDKKHITLDIECVQSEYSLGTINHDDYARIACEIYAKAMYGITKKDYDALVFQFLKEDRKALFAFTKSLFRYLYQNNIQPIIISGAPLNILNHYSEEFKLYKIFAFSERFEEGICTGTVEYNYGVNKRNTLEGLIKTFGENPCIGFGDSSSDIPLFELSKHAFCIIDDKTAIGKYGNKPKYLLNTISGKEMISIMDGLSL